MDDNKKYTPATVAVTLQPGGTVFSMQRPKTALQLLRKLDIKPGSALVIRNQELLTPDREILPDDVIIVRVVTSSG